MLDNKSFRKRRYTCREMYTLIIMLLEFKFLLQENFRKRCIIIWFLATLTRICWRQKGNSGSPHCLLLSCSWSGHIGLDIFHLSLSRFELRLEKYKLNLKKAYQIEDWTYHNFRPNMEFCWNHKSDDLLLRGRNRVGSHISQMLDPCEIPIHSWIFCSFWRIWEHKSKLD